MTELTTTRQQKAEQNFLQIQRIVEITEGNFLVLARLLWECQQEGYWSDIGRESFRELIEEVGLHYSTAIKLASSYQEYILKLGMTEKQLLLIGTSKLYMMLPEAKKGTMTAEEVIEKGQLSVEHLGEELGHKTTETDRQDYGVVCNRCGEKLYGVRYVRKPKGE